MAYTTIDDPSAYFQIATYTGNVTNRTITNDGNSDLQPDLIWFKNRDTTNDHEVFDSSRGKTRRLRPNSTAADDDSDTRVRDFNTDGFDCGTDPSANGDGNEMVAWQWKANGGTTSSNSDGSLTSTAQANTTAGFSIVTWTADGGGAKTIGHGLGAVPKWIITKNRTDDANWQIYHASNTSAPETEVIYFTTGATQDYDGFMADTAPTSSVFTVGGDGSMNGTSGKNIVAYCFAEKQGYSKFGSYVGNGSEPEGPFIYTGFKPAWFMVHASSESGQAWFIGDNKRDPHNMAVAKLAANTTSVESAAVGDNNWDFLSNGFKIRTQDDAMNKSGVTFIYMAFAESPFVSSEGVPTTAR